MPILSVWLINKSGGLIFQKDFPTESVTAPKLSTNDFLVLAGTFQRYLIIDNMYVFNFFSVHAIATQLNPTGSKCSGIESLEWYGYSKPTHADSPFDGSCPFKLNCFQSPTGLKILLLTSPRQPQLDYILKRIYELYADYAMKNPFHTPEMPVRSEKFETGLGKLVKQMSTNNYF